jgi:copper chaperone CopZ
MALPETGKLKHGEYPGGVFASIMEDGGFSMEKRLKLSIAGMHCDACVRRVTAALQAVKGVEVNSVDVGSARTTFDPDQASVEEILSAVNRIGFSASVATL